MRAKGNGKWLANVNAHCRFLSPGFLPAGKRLFSLTIKFFLMTSPEKPILIVGGGIIGLSVGWQLLRHGFAVTLIERDEAGHSASWASAGMIAPHAEAGFEDMDLLKLDRASLEAYPQFLDELKADTDIEVVLDQRGTLIVGLDRDDTLWLRRLYDFREHLGFPLEWMSGSEAREKEPSLSPKVVSAMWLPKDAQIENRELLNALRKAFLLKGGSLLEHCEVLEILVKDGRAIGVKTPKEVIEGSEIILAAGSWSREISGIPEALRPPVRPVKGQVMTATRDESCPLECMIRSPRIYLAPKLNGRLSIGASTEEKGFHTIPTIGIFRDILDEAWRAMPSIYDLEIEEFIAGLRPGSRDHAPIIGHSGINNLIYATGHYRHGILLAPITAYEILKLMKKETSELLLPFSPMRFHEKTAVK